MNLETMRLIVRNNMPYDTGFMYIAGSKLFETEHFLLCKYDTERVPYIVYQEEGTIYSKKNQGFISRKTVGDLNQHIAFENSGIKPDTSVLEERAKRRGSTNMLAEGTLEKISADGGKYRYAGNI